MLIILKTPQEITKTLYDKSFSFLEKSNTELIIGGILAGIFVGLAAITSVTVCQDMATYFGVGFTKLIFGIVFSLAMIIIVISGSELFTGSNLYIVSVFKNKANFNKIFRRWGIVYFANMAGCIILIFFIFQTGIFDDKSISDYMIYITKSKLNLTASQAFFRGILCNFMVCLAARMGEASDEIPGKIIGFIYVIGAFVVNSFEHSIANIFFIPTGIILGNQQGISLSWQSFIFENLIPVTIGNIVGGALFVGIVYYVLHNKYFRKNKNIEVGSDIYGDFTA